MISFPFTLSPGSLFLEVGAADLGFDTDRREELTHASVELRSLLESPGRLQMRGTTLLQDDIVRIGAIQHAPSIRLEDAVSNRGSDSRPRHLGPPNTPRERVLNALWSLAMI